MEFNLADLFESAVDQVPDREFLIVDDQRRTYAQVEERSNRFAHHLARAGIEAGDHVAILGRNSAEWVEAMWAVFKLRAVPINLNFRYTEPELHYLLDNSDAAALVCERQYAPLVAGFRAALPLLRHVVVIEDGSSGPDGDAAPYEAALEASSPERDFEPRSENDGYILYTGGTTGRPKGVVWRHYDQFMAFGGRGDTSLTPEDVVRRALKRPASVSSSFAPLMHNNGQWTTMGAAFTGNKAVLMRKFDARRAWMLVGREGVQVMRLVGDAMARPLVDALRLADPAFDVSSVRAISSGGATLSPAAKAGLLEMLPGVRLVETIGSTESGNEGSSTIASGSVFAASTRVDPAPGTVVVDEALRAVAVGEVGRIARTGFIPLGYYKDPEKTEATFPVIGGQRYVVPGDFARVEEDGTITMLGRGSMVINTGGEKVHPEEVESVVRAYPDVLDAVVIGIPDERWGHSVAAVVQTRTGAVVSLDALRLHCLESLAAYKVPTSVFLVDEFHRHESGKPDYRWAETVVTGAATSASGTPHGVLT